MKKIFLKSFCARFLTLLVLALMSTNLAWGADATDTWVFTSKEFKTTLNGNVGTTWTATNGTSSITNASDYNDTKGIQTTLATMVLKCPTSYNNVKTIVISYSTNSSSEATIDVKAGTNTAISKTVEKSKTNVDLTYNFTKDESNQNIEITCKRNGSSGSLYIKTIKVTYSAGPTKLSAPTGLQSANVTQTSADLSWTAVANASSYTLAYKKTVDDEFTEIEFIRGSTLSDLSVGTEYTWKVKAVGNGTSYSTSDYSETSTFTTVSDTKYTVTFNAGTNGTCETTSLTEASAGAGVELPSCTPNSGYAFIGWSTTSDATEADAGEANATYHPTANITLYAVYKEVYTITWSVNGASTTEGNPTTSVVAGEGITTLPTAPADISGMAFQGWTATQIATSSATAPTDLFTDAEHAPAITANTTFYAVFAEESEGDVTWNIANDIAANDVIIIATNKNYTDHDMKTAGAIENSLMSCKASTFNSDKTQITSVADGTLEFTLGGNSTSGWILQNGTNYLGMSGDKKVALSSTSSTWAINITDGVATVSQKYYVDNNTEKNYRLQYNYNNGNTDRFTGYTSNQVTISLYKKTQGITYSNYCTTVPRTFTKTISDRKMATLYLDYAVTIPTDVKAYTAADKGDHTAITLEKITDGVIPANTGVIVYADVEENTSFVFVETATTKTYDNNCLKGVTEKTAFDAVADYDATTYNYYALMADGETSVVFKLVNGGSYAANSAYLVLPKTANAKVDFTFDDEPTGIESLTPALSEGKGVYNLQGVRVNNGYKGIVIMNGKKYINK